MTKQLMIAIRDVLEQVRKQGTDNMGYVHYVEKYYFDILEHEFNKELKKHGDFRYEVKGVSHGK